MGLDIGGRRTGVALSDPLGVTCRPLVVVDESDQDRLVERIVALAEEHGVEELVVGLPRPLSGGTNRQVETVWGFVRVLGERAGLPVRTWDERFTSKMAGPVGKTAGSRDAVAACYMLQNYLDAQANARGEE
jgi:putative Holliday junction resolvase